jgi:hypothetical protein
MLKKLTELKSANILQSLLPKKSNKDVIENLKNSTAGKSVAQLLKEAELKGVKDFYELRKLWSKWIIFWIFFLLLSNVSIVLLIGFGLVKFDNSLTFVTKVVIGNFIEIIGMGIVVVKFFHKDFTNNKNSENKKQQDKKTN